MGSVALPTTQTGITPTYPRHNRFAPHVVKAEALRCEGGSNRKARSPPPLKTWAGAMLRLTLEARMCLRYVV